MAVKNHLKERIYVKVEFQTFLRIFARIATKSNVIASNSYLIVSNSYLIFSNLYLPLGFSSSLCMQVFLPSLTQLIVN
jgi:hypothetical protein